VSGGVIVASVVYIHQVEDETTHDRGEGWKEAIEQKLRPNCLQEKKSSESSSSERQDPLLSSAKKV